MGLPRFYWFCLRRALRTYWAVLGVASTLLTFAVPLTLYYWPPAASPVANLVIGLLPVLALLVCLVAGPLREAHRAYREKVAELGQERERHAREVSELRRAHAAETEGLRRDLERARQANGGRAAVRHHLEEVLAQFQALAGQVARGDRGAAVRVYPLEFRTARYLEEHLRQYRGFEAGCPVKDTVPHEGEVNPEDARRRCEERIARLKVALSFLG